MNRPIFVTGIGTGVGKTVVSAILVEALECDYWKPVQSGNESPTDRESVQGNLTNLKSIVHPEYISLKMPASPHYSAMQENISFTVAEISQQIPKYNCNLIVEGAGGLLVPLNENEFIIDLIKSINAKVVLVSSGYLGSINHSLLTAADCARHQLDVVGWVFNDCLPLYESQISRWSGYPPIFSLPKTDMADKIFVKKMADTHRESIKTRLC